MKVGRGRLENKGLAIGGGSKKVQYLVFITHRPPPPIINDRSLTRAIGISMFHKICYENSFDIYVSVLLIPIWSWIGQLSETHGKRVLN